MAGGAIDWHQLDQLRRLAPKCGSLKSWTAVDTGIASSTRAATLPHRGCSGPPRNWQGDKGVRTWAISLASPASALAGTASAIRPFWMESIHWAHLERRRRRQPGERLKRGRSGHDHRRRLGRLTGTVAWHGSDDPCERYGAAEHRERHACRSAFSYCQPAFKRDGKAPRAAGYRGAISPPGTLRLSWRDAMSDDNQSTCAIWENGRCRFPVGGAARSRGSSQFGKTQPALRLQGLLPPRSEHGGAARYRHQDRMCDAIDRMPL